MFTSGFDKSFWAKRKRHFCHPKALPILMTNVKPKEGEALNRQQFDDIEEGKTNKISLTSLHIFAY